VYHKYINWAKFISRKESELSSWSVAVGMLLTANQSASSPKENPEARAVSEVDEIEVSEC
jgi:hypothetical protein